MHVPPRTFEKYARWGDYHWRQYAQGAKYKTLADRVVRWFADSRQVILDVGAGDGKITSLLNADGHHVIGIDDEPEAVNLARKKGVDVRLGSAYDLPFEDGSFDAVLMADVLEHLERPEIALAEARRVLIGCLYVTTPPKRPDGKLTDKYHWTEWTPEELKELVETVGFELEGEIDVNVKDKVMYAKFRRTP